MAADPIAFQLGSQFQPDELDIQRKQAMVNALMQQAQQGPQGSMVSGHYISPGIGGALLPLVQMLAARHAQSKIGDQQRDLMTRNQQALKQAMAEYTTNQTQDQRGAALSAAVSPFPQLASLGNEDFKSQLAGRLTQKDVFNNPNMSTPSKLQALRGPNIDISSLKSAPHILTANDKVISVDPDTGQAPVLTDARTTYGGFGPVADTPSGPLYGQKSDTGEIKSPPPGTNINLNTQQTASDAFAEKIAGARADSLVTTRNAAIEGNKALSQIGDAQAALDNGIKSGAGANTKLLLAKVGKAFGLSDDPAIVNSEGYKAAVMNQVLGSVKTLGSNPSEADREFVNAIKGGDINLDAGTLQHLLKVAKAAAGNDILAHQHNLAVNRGGTGALPQDLEAMNVPFNFAAPDLEFDQGTGRLRAPILQNTNGPKVMHFDAQGNLVQ